MRILRTIPMFRPVVNGPVNQAEAISRGLAERGIFSDVYTTFQYAPETALQEEYEGWRLRRLRESVGFLAYRHIFGVEELLNVDADLVHAHLYRNAMTSAAAAYARKKDVPLVLQPHGTLSMYRYLFADRRLMQFPYRAYDWMRKSREVDRADAVIVATEQEREEAVQYGIAPEKIHVIPVGATPFDLADRRTPGTAEKLTLLFVGRIAPDRRVEQIIQAVGKLRPTHRQQIELRIVGPVGLRSLLHNGDAYLRRLKELCATKRIDDCVVFVGPKYGDDLQAEYQKADVFVYTSEYENFGQTMLEAAAHGCPLIATPTGVARDLIEEGVTGFFVPHRETDSLAERIEHLVVNRVRLADLGHGIYEKARREFCWHRIIVAYEDLYHCLLKASRDEKRQIPCSEIPS